LWRSEEKMEKTEQLEKIVGASSAGKSAQLAKNGRGKKRQIVIIGLVVLLVALGALVFLYIRGGAIFEDVAATVNGNRILERQVTERIMATKQRYESEKDWAGALKSAGYEPKSLRESIVNACIEDELLAQYAKEEGISYDKEAVQRELNVAKDTGKDFKQYLKESGFSTEDDFKNFLIKKNITEKVSIHLVDKEKLSDEQIDEALTNNKFAYFGRRVSVIVFKGNAGSTSKEKETLQKEAQKVLKKLENEDFAVVAKEHSQDKESAKNGGDLGYVAINKNIPADVVLAVNTLEIGQVSSLVTVGEDIYIVKCTENITVETENKDLPNVLKDEIIKGYKLTISSGKLVELKRELMAKAKVKINEMPKGLPYDLDVDKVLKD
jgi:parvulin-like peptidyl-prolyl isomerase